MSRKIWKAQIALAVVTALVLVPMEAENSYLPTCMNEEVSPEPSVRKAAVIRMGTCSFGSSSCCAGEPEAECSRGGPLQKYSEERSGPQAGFTLASFDHPGPITRAATPATGSCRTAPASRLPSFTISGVWSQGELLFLDNHKRSILRYSETGKWLGELPGVVPDYMKTWMPRTLLGAGNGKFLIQADFNRFAAIDAGYSFKNMTKRPVSNGDAIDQILISTAAQGRSGGEEIVGFAGVQKADGTWDRGFVRFPVNGSGFQWLVRGIQDEERNFYKLTLPLITSIGTTAYFVRMEDPVTLYRQESGTSSPSAMAALDGYASTHRLPQLPRLLRAEDFPHAMSVIERSSMPVGLYSFESKLYVLLRDASREKTSWSIIVIDPGRDAVRAMLKMSFATGLAPEHLTVVPGPRHWAILLKGAASGLVSQDVYRLVLADAQAFRPPFTANIRCS